MKSKGSLKRTFPIPISIILQHVSQLIFLLKKLCNSAGTFTFYLSYSAVAQVVHQRTNGLLHKSYHSRQQELCRILAPIFPFWYRIQQHRHKTYDNRAATVSYHQVHKHGAYLNPILKKLVINSPLKSGILNSKLLHAKVSNNSLFILTTCCLYFIHKPKLLIENWSGGPI